MGREDVDFVVGDEASRARPAGPPPHRDRRRLLLVLAAAVVVLAGAGIAVRAATHRTAASTAVPSASTATPSASTTADRDSSTALDPSRAIASPVPAPTDRLGCPEFVACTKTTTVPPVVVQAVRAVFPRAQPVSGQTIVLHRDNTATAEVHARLLQFHVGGYELFLRVSTPGSDDGGAIPVNTRTVIRTVPTGQYVTIEAAAPNGEPLPSYDVLQKLVADSRLLAT